MLLTEHVININRNLNSPKGLNSSKSLRFMDFHFDGPTYVWIFMPIECKPSAKTSYMKHENNSSITEL